ncbi:protein adenylyltransferase SelO [Thalassomonas sp. M1454]|uniref:protein adenylyltransferase SelO n=1 Tax=Thalassomonas sp. M1454 TaxID=2594477 RepID=UPI00117F33A8|nr:YdiU family protein [Thalassomonas sp. M1454]TRX55075.1 YdiU family protein [Thalassomonas sp. M1454]
MKFSNSYINLGSDFFQTESPESVAKPQLLLFNQPLAQQLNMADELAGNNDDLSLYFSGNKILPGAQPIALAYAGHQFGGFNPQLGDGRAVLLGEVIDINNQRQDIQLKGSGRTPFSRQGDGKCAIGPAIREYIMSEAMHALGVPTSRCLAVTATGEQVYRDTVKPGAVVTRVAASHIRVGTFQYFAARGNSQALKQLTQYTIARHFPEISIDMENRELEFLKAVIAKQIKLIVSWMRVGFIHGVMNTDNNSISGETIDFGPCAMMGTYHPGTVFSSIDSQGRYAFANQPHIAQWNMARLAECLLPLISDDTEQALALVEPIIVNFSADFEQAYFTMLGHKLGFEEFTQFGKEAINELLSLMQDLELDYTETFQQLTLSLLSEQAAEKLKATIGGWYEKWRLALQVSNISNVQANKLMTENNPVVIPRNHHVEAVLAHCEQTLDMDLANEFLEVLRSPYKVISNTVKYQDTPIDQDQGYRTFCGT